MIARKLTGEGNDGREEDALHGLSGWEMVMGGRSAQSALQARELSLRLVRIYFMQDGSKFGNREGN